MELNLRIVILSTLALLALLVIILLVCIKRKQSRRKRTAGNSADVDGDYSYTDLTTLIDAIQLEISEQNLNAQTLQSSRKNLLKVKDVIAHLQTAHSHAVEELATEVKVQHNQYEGQLEKYIKENKQQNDKIEIMDKQLDFLRYMSKRSEGDRLQMIVDIKRIRSAKTEYTAKYEFAVKSVKALKKISRLQDAMSIIDNELDRDLIDHVHYIKNMMSDDEIKDYFRFSKIESVVPQAYYGG